MKNDELKKTNHIKNITKRGYHSEGFKLNNTLNECHKTIKLEEVEGIVLLKFIICNRKEREKFIDRFIDKRSQGFSF